MQDWWQILPSPCWRAMNLLVDSTCIKFRGEGEWQTRNHGVQGRRQWRNVHPAMDAATSDIHAVDFTPGREDAPSCHTCWNRSPTAKTFVP